MNAMNPGKVTAAPQNVSVEQQVLGMVLSNNKAYFRVSEFMKPEFFTEPLHQEMWKVTSEMIEAGRLADVRTVKTYLPQDSKVGGFTLNEYMAHLLADHMPISMILQYAVELVRVYLLRKCIISCEGGITECMEPRHDVPVSVTLHRISSELSDLIGIADRVSKTGAITLADATDAVLKETADAFQGSKSPGYDIGLEFMNRLTGPWMPTQFVIIGAATKMGKSALAMQAAMAIAGQGGDEPNHVLYFSPEMEARLLASRQLAGATKIGTLRQRRGNISADEYENLVDAGAKLRVKGADNIHIISEKKNIDEIFAQARAFKKRHGRLAAVFVDHLGIIGKPKELRSTSDWELAAHAAPIMGNMAKELDCVTVGLSQVLKENPAAGISRKNEEETIKAKIAACLVKPHYGQLKGAIANDADHVIMPFRAEAALSRIEPAEGSIAHHIWKDAMNGHIGKAEIVLALSRESHWPKTIPALWDGPATAFRDDPIEEPRLYGT